MGLDISLIQPNKWVTNSDFETSANSLLIQNPPESYIPTTRYRIALACNVNGFVGFDTYAHARRQHLELARDIPEGLLVSGDRTTSCVDGADGFADISSLDTAGWSRSRWTSFRDV